MRVVIALLAIMLLTVPALSQGASKGKRQHGTAATTPSSKKVDDKAYKSALDRIPNQKFDPWNGVR